VNSSHNSKQEANIRKLLEQIKV